MVIGAHCTNGAADLILNDHVMGVVTGAHCPVLVWRHAPDGGKDRPVVVGVDESKSAPAALEAAFGVAEALHAPVDVAHVWETDAAVGLGYAAGPVDWDLEHAMKTEQARQLEALVAPVAARHRRVHTSVVLADGGPAKKLVELSTTARVVVVGTDHGRVSGAILGSVAQNVVHHAKCPVLVARA